MGHILHCRRLRRPNALTRTALLGLLLLALALRAQAQAPERIDVLFNQSVDHTASPITDATTTAYIEDTIVAHIAAAQSTLDIAVWDNGSAKIVSAINAAHVRGVQVRYISSTNALNSALGNLDPGIPVLKRNAGLTSNVMHNKFVIIDSAVVLTGSMNFGMGSMQDDFNNLVRIRSAALAINYITEFNEMWGGAGAQPNLSNSKFGPDKLDNTIHNFTIAGSTVESYFSPSDQTTAHLVSAINTADSTLDIAMFTFIHNDLGDAVIAAHNRGVRVRCIMENVSYFGSEYNALVGSGIAVQSEENQPFDFHHKYCIIDGSTVSSDPIVITGSHNWTNSAEDDYDENTLLIHDHRIAQQYLEEFEARWNLTNAMVTEADICPIQLFPNPVSDLLHLRFPSTKSGIVEVHDVLGNCVIRTDSHAGAMELSVASLPSGIYRLQLRTGREVYSGTFVKR